MGKSTCSGVESSECMDRCTDRSVQRSGVAVLAQAERRILSPCGPHGSQLPVESDAIIRGPVAELDGSEGIQMDHEGALIRVSDAHSEDSSFPEIGSGTDRYASLRYDRADSVQARPCPVSGDTVTQVPREPAGADAIHIADSVAWVAEARHAGRLGQIRRECVDPPASAHDDVRDADGRGHFAWGVDGGSDDAVLNIERGPTVGFAVHAKEVTRQGCVVSSRLGGRDAVD